MQGPFQGNFVCASLAVAMVLSVVLILFVFCWEFSFAIKGSIIGVMGNVREIESSPGLGWLVRNP